MRFQGVAVLDSLKESFDILFLGPREWAPLRQVPLLWKVEAQLWWHYLCRFIPLDIWLQGLGTGRPFGDFRFGETPWFTGRQILAWAEIGPEDIFFDLGCGRGKMVFLAALDRGCRSVGVDLLPGYIRIARKIAARAGLEGITFYQRDFSQVDLSSATAVFVAGSIFTDETRQLLEGLVDQLEPGAQWLSVSWPTRHPALELLDQREFLFSWGRETVYRQRVALVMPHSAAATEGL